MGDADLPHQGMNGAPADEMDVEERLDEIHDQLEEQIDIVYDMFQVLERRMNSKVFVYLSAVTALVLTAFVRLHRVMWETFMAFNVFVIPIALATIFSYFTRDLILTEDFATYRQVVVSSLFMCAVGLGIPLYLRSLWRMRYANKEEAEPSSRSIFYMLVEDEGEDGDIDSDEPRSDASEFSTTSTTDTDQQPEEDNRFNRELVPPPNNLNPFLRNLLAPLNIPPSMAPGEMNAPIDNVLRFLGNQNANLNNQNQTDRNAPPSLSNLSMVTRNLLPPLNNTDMVDYVPQLDEAQRDSTEYTVDSIEAPPGEREGVD